MRRFSGETATCTATPFRPHTQTSHICVPWPLPRDPIFTTPPNGPALTHRLAYLDTSRILQEGFLACALSQTRLRKKHLFSCRAIDSLFLYCSVCFRPLYWRTIVLSIRNHGCRTTSHGEPEHLQDQGVERSESCCSFLLMLLYPLTDSVSCRPKRETL